MLNTT